MKHLKVKQNYGLETVPIYFDKLMFGSDFASETAPTMRKKSRFYALMEQEIEHPILVWHNINFGELEIFNGGLRVMVAVEKGFESIDGIVRGATDMKANDKDFILLEKLKKIQQQDAKNYFKSEDLELAEI